jgi:hypothetical protein
MERFATNPNLDADKIEKLFNIFIDGQRKMREMNDEQEFAHRMADFKKNPPSIIKSRIADIEKDGRKLYSYNFADLDAYASAIMGGLAERGITWGFPFSENNGLITVSCILRYGLYKHTPTTLTNGPDTTGGKNPIQAKASTLSYLERYTLCGASGFTAAMPDTDGKGDMPAVQIMPDPELLEWLDGINQSPDDAELARLVKNAREAAAKYDCQVSYLAIDKAAILASHSLKTLLQVFPKMYAKWEGKQNFKAARELGEAFEKRKAQLEAM